jgi:CRP/FNR family transcriptional regulator, cyclic AMP receptor protein
MAAEEITISKNEYLMREGDESKAMYYIKEGVLTVFKRKGDKDVQIGTVYSGELIGEMSFLDKLPRSASVMAISDCQCIEIPREKFDKLFEKLPPWFFALLNTLLDRLRKANARVKI